MKHIGLFGGTFNPVHIEHQQMAKTAIAELKLDKLIVVPTFSPPHKKTHLLSGEDRFNMLKTCFHKMGKVEVSDYELNSGGVSYTYLTAEHYKSLYPEDKLYLLVGGDMLTDFKTWKYPERILAVCDLAVFTREDFGFDFNFEREYFNKTFGKDFTLLSYNGKNVSSTRVRIYAELGLPLEGMVDAKVEEYIKEKALFPSGKEAEFIKKSLTEKRLVHTAEVTVTALKKVKELGLDLDKVKTTCLLHDCAKYLDKANFKGFTLPIDVPKPVEHAFLGAYVAEKVLKITDTEIIEAIKYHTSGKANMSTLGKLVFVADMIERTRNYQGVEQLRELYEKDFDECFRACLEEEMAHLLNKKSYIYSETLNAYEYYINKK